MNKKTSVKDINGNGWVYSKTVEDHFFNPRNVMTDNIDENEFDAVGEVGSPACGDLMKVWIKVEKDVITDFKWKTFGCASAIASTSILSEMAQGKPLCEANKITAQDIVEKLGGLPKRKIHCSVLGDQALRMAIKNYCQKDKTLNPKS
jgi:NifU-like protein involved in Fe-S cluster formation